MDRNNEGLLSEDEKAELQALVEISEELSLVRATGVSVPPAEPHSISRDGRIQIAESEGAENSK
jgi:hypothetical protein